jgi:hypothetical protein
MSAVQQTQWLRGFGLFVGISFDVLADSPAPGGGNLGNQFFDLSALRFRFRTQQFDDETPNTCEIRVYNLSPQTVRKVREEYSRVVLQAGYINGSVGTIFDGDIRQFRTGREDALNSYLDILAADGTLPYGFGFVNGSVPSATLPADYIRRVAESGSDPLLVGHIAPVFNGSEGKSIRSKVYFGMMRDVLRDAANTAQATWSIQNGKLQFIPLTGYLPGDVVKLNAFSGVIGVPELTEQGLKIRTLINPRLTVGGLVQINNKDVNTIVQAGGDPRQYNSWKEPQHLASLSADGIYRAYVIEHSGDTRGQEWYSDLVCLSVNNGQVAAFGILDD